MTRFLDALDDEIADLEKQLEADPKFLKLRELNRLRELYASNFSKTLFHALGEVARALPRQPTGKSLEALTAAKELLEHKEAPVPTSEILAYLETKGVTFGGASPQNTLSSILSKSPDFKANGRTGWTLIKEKADDDVLG